LALLKTKPAVGVQKKILLLLIGLINCACSFSQTSNQRTKNIFVLGDTISLDTLSVVANSVSIKKINGEPIDTSKYKIDYAKALLIFSSAANGLRNDSLVVSYNVFPFLFSKEYKHKDVRKIQNNQFGEPYIYNVDKNKPVDFFKTEGLTKSGSLSRGISFGNNQDVVLNSNLNLQLAGKVSDNMDILLAATDQNIPVQPDGNTQQLQEFDKVFIQIGIKDLPKSGKTLLTAGDFQMMKPDGYFMVYNKRNQGLSIETKMAQPKSSELIVRGSVAVSKGKFARNISVENKNGNTFNGQRQERNQGAYKLRGAENEQFIIVLAGTEMVYLDGKLLERGQENDYIIDYNTSEITFTPKNLITKDKRISVEFQYSDKNYARSLAHAGSEYKSKKINVRLNGYTEQDNKNRPLQQQLDNPEKLLLSIVGDSLHQAITSSADSIPFNNTEVLYDKLDSSIGTFTYPSIYMYSTDTAKAHFRLSFSFVGINKGNYKLKQSAANGKVYEWVVPDTVSGQPTGSYEPVILLISPKQKQMVTAGADIIFSKNSILSFEGAISNNDINTFSEKDKKDNTGLGGKINWDHIIPLTHKENDTGNAMPSWKLVTNANYEFLQKTFSPIERFRSVEFIRDWNRINAIQQDDQHIMGGRIGIAKKNNLLSYDYKSFMEGRFYNAMRHSSIVNIASNGYLINADGSYLNSKSSLNNSNFLRHRATASKEIPVGLINGKFTAGVREKQEHNLIQTKLFDSLMAGSARFMEWEPFVELKDSSNNKYSLSYKQRTDYAISNLKGAELHRATLAEDYGGGMELFSNPNSQFRFTGSYRKLKMLDTTITIQKSENTVVGRVEYNFALLKGFISSQTFYEVGSGLELKRDFIFLEVAPGQGTHIWVDYNKNGVKELNEFEISLFPNEANYIKVWTPTDDYISIYTNQFSEVFNIRPSAKWSGKKGIKKTISRFGNQTAYRTDRKTTNTDLAIAYNPFASDTKDSTLITLNSSLRNTIFFNQNDPVFGMDFTWQDVENKSLLVNDTVFRTNTYSETKIRWNVNRKWTWQGSFKEGIKQNNSKFFTARNYRITYYEAEPKIILQSSATFRVIMSYKYSEKKNTISILGAKAELVQAQNYGSEIKYSALNKGSLAAKANFILISYNSVENTPLAYEMLDGLKTGNNYTWGVAYNRTLASNIQLTLSYDGRNSPGVKTIHTGNAQVRAYF